jgi:PIN domain nuclease of toxin-antitoxin system
VRLLLDTHTLIWWLENRALSKAARDAMRAPETALYVSAVSAYEISLKVTLGKLPSCAPLVPRFSETLLMAGIRHMEVTPRHGLEAGRLPLIHRDPFDRILVAQSIGERMPIVSDDEKLSALGAKRVW